MTAKRIFRAVSDEQVGVLMKEGFLLVESFARESVCEETTDTGVIHFICSDDCVDAIAGALVEGRVFKK